MHLIIVAPIAQAESNELRVYTRSF